MLPRDRAGLRSRARGLWVGHAPMMHASAGLKLWPRNRSRERSRRHPVRYQPGPRDQPHSSTRHQAKRSWLNQIEIVFTVVQRKVLTPNDFPSLQALVDQLDAFEHHYNQIATPFTWTFTRDDLQALIARVAEHEPRLRLAA